MGHTGGVDAYKFHVQMVPGLILTTATYIENKNKNILSI
jgi:hypothetical protein